MNTKIGSPYTTPWPRAKSTAVPTIAIAAPKRAQQREPEPAEHELLDDRHEQGDEDGVREERRRAARVPALGREPLLLAGVGADGGHEAGHDVDADEHREREPERLPPGAGPPEREHLRVGRPQVRASVTASRNPNWISAAKNVDHS